MLEPPRVQPPAAEPWSMLQHDAHPARDTQVASPLLLLVAAGVAAARLRNLLQLPSSCKPALGTPEPLPHACLPAAGLPRACVPLLQPAHQHQLPECC